MSVRRYLGAALQVLPAELRLGSTYSTWRTAIARARHDPDLILQKQQHQLRHVLAMALARSSYYRAMFTSIYGPGVRAEDLISAEQWRRIPVLSSQIVCSEAERMCTQSPDLLSFVTTSGSSGQPLPFFIDRHRSPVEYAFVMDQWARAGCTPNDWRAWFRGWDFPDVDRMPFEVERGLRELRISVFHLQSHLMARYAEEIEQRRIVFLQGYPSAIATFAAFLSRSEHSLRDKIRGILLHSEPLYPEFRLAIERGFPNAKLIPFYGLSEKCAFGAEVEDRPNVYEMDPLYGFTELLDNDDEPITEPGRVGRLVSTGLLFTGMPFIRYDTGDTATLVELPNMSNGYRLRVADITPRRGSGFFVSRGNDLIPSTFLEMGDDSLRFIADYQLEQHTPGEVHLRVVLAEGAPADALDTYIELIAQRTAGELTFIPEIVEAIPLSGRGKRKLVIQHLDIAAAINAVPSA